MAQIKGLSDFVLTGCAILPAVGLIFGRPEFALLSHIVLLFGGILIAGTEDDAPFKQIGLEERDPSEQTGAGRSTPQGLSRPNAPHVPQPLHRQSARSDKSSNRSATASKLK